MGINGVDDVIDSGGGDGDGGMGGSGRKSKVSSRVSLRLFIASYQVHSIPLYKDKTTKTIQSLDNIL